MKPCMGGWCFHRDKCPHHGAEGKATPAERLCLRGQDGWQAAENSQGGIVKRFVLPVALMPRPLPSSVGAPA